MLRDYLLVTRNIDPVALERGRMATLQQGRMPDKTALGLLAYAAFQELATRSPIATPAAIDDPVADRIMLRVAADENLHMMFYRDIVAAALQVDLGRGRGDHRRGDRLRHARGGHPGLHRKGPADGPGRHL